MNTIDRRDFLTRSAALTGGALLQFSNSARAEPPPETTRIRLTATPAICIAPQYVAEPLLRAEGFTDIQYVDLQKTGPSMRIASGAADVTMDSVGEVVTRIDAGDPLVVLAGVHLGCYELFGSDRVQAIRDLKGKRVPIDGFGGPQHVFLSSMIAYVGLNPRTDIN